MDFGAVSRLRRALLVWYRRVARDLPWRRTRDPYRIWLSEVMLQQTRVETVIPYYRRFLQRFPTVRRLAAAKIDDVLKRWEGLGYYSRARNLHRAAQVVAHEFAGRFPSSAKELRLLPGVGRYTAAAIASIAFDEPVAALDGNIKRVLARLHAVSEPIDDRRTETRLWQLADALLARRDPGDFNQAMMELGATVCLPRAPRCGECPLASACRTHAADLSEAIPLKRRRMASPLREAAVVAVSRGGRWLIQRRPPNGLLGGLWRLPATPLRSGESADAAAARLLADELRLCPRSVERLGTVDHLFTHFRLRGHVFACKLNGEATRLGTERKEGTWATRARLEKLAFATVDRKLMKLALRATPSE